MGLDIKIGNNYFTTIKDLKKYYDGVYGLAKELGLKELSWLDSYGYVKFEANELDELQKDIEIIKKHPKANQEMLNTIQTALNEAKRLNVSVEFIGD